MELVLFALVGLLACCLAGSVWRAAAKRESAREFRSSCRPVVEWLSELSAPRRAVVCPAKPPFLPVVELLAQRIVPAATAAKFEWTGAVNTAWNNAGNWTRIEGTAGQYPGDEGADDVNDQAIFTPINVDNNGCVLTFSVTMKNLYMNFNKSLEVTNGATLTVKGLIEPGPTGNSFGFRMYEGLLLLKDNAKLNLQGTTNHSYKGGTINSGGTGLGTVFVSDNSVLSIGNDGDYLGAHLVVGKDAAGNESPGRVILQSLNSNVTLDKNANITNHKQGTLEFAQSQDSDTKGGIVRADGSTSKIDNYGKFLRTTKDTGPGNKFLKIEPPVEGLGADSLLHLGKECLIDFTNKYHMKGGRFDKHPDGSRIKGFKAEDGTMKILDPGAAGTYYTYIDDGLLWNGGAIVFEHTTSGALTTLVIADAFTMGGGSLTASLGDKVTVGNGMTQAGGSVSVAGYGSQLTVTGAYQQSGGTATFDGTGGQLSVIGAATISGSYTTLTLQNSGLLEATGGLTIQSGATLNGYGGGITGNVTNAGILNLADGVYTLNITGDYEQTGTLKVGLAGTSNYSRLIVSGEAELGGTLKVLLYGFTPSPGNTFILVTAGSGISGAFAIFDLPTLGFGVWHHDTEGDTIWVSYF